MKFVVLFLLVFESLSIAHPLHISMTTIEFGRDDEISLIVKLFSDDFENIVKAKYGVDMGLTKTTVADNALQLGAKYILSNLSFTSGKPIVFSPVRLERNEEATWFYMKAKYSGAEVITIKNSLMVDVFADQRNLMIIVKGERQKAIRFDNESKEEILLVNDF